MFRADVLIIRRSKLYYKSSGIITPIGGRPVHRLREVSQCFPVDIGKCKRYPQIHFFIPMANMVKLLRTNQAILNPLGQKLTSVIFKYSVSKHNPLVPVGVRYKA